MPDLELGARFALAALCALITIVLFRDHRESAVGRFGGLLAIAVVAEQVVALSEFRGEPLGALFHFGAISGAMWLWLLARALFEDGFQWRNAYWLVFAALAVSAAGAYFSTNGFQLNDPNSTAEIRRSKMLLIPQQTLILAFAALAVYEAVKDWRSDLVRSRRRFRRFFVVGLTLLLIIVSFTNYAQLGTPENVTINATASVATLAVAVYVFASLLQINRRRIDLADPFPSASTNSLDDPIAGSIEELMAERKLYREHGLTISDLADAAKEKEYRVRQVINGNMGYRNFSQYLNHHRVREVAERLRDPGERDLPVLTLAMDAGYASLAPFNNAFKAAHGMTPREYRRRNAGPG